RFRMIARASRGTVLEDLCNRLTTDDGIHHGAGMAYEKVLLRSADKKTKQALVEAANRLLPTFVEHALWRPKERALIGGAMRAIDPIKDVDGLHPLNAGQLFFGAPTFAPATPIGIMRLLAEYGVQLSGARAVVVGRSLIVGRPVALLLLHENATVTICHSRTDDLARQTLDADILVVAVGQAGVVSADMVKAGAAVLDVGMNRTEAGLVGDVDASAADVAAFMTPVPGGVGPMTIAMLLGNAVRAARYRRRILAFPQVRR